MTLLPCMFAQVYFDNAVDHWKNTSPVLRDVIVVMVAGCAVGLIALLWAALVRKRKRRHRHHHHHSSSAGTQAASSLASAEVSDNGLERRRKRRRRRDHRPRNPTLAETGGLPPVRTDTPGENDP
jgi:Flp pilus assembly protein TadB